MKMEAHIHTRFSWDSYLSLWVLYLICRLKGTGAVVVTDHNCLAGGLRFREKFGMRSPGRYRFIRGLQVVAGSEIFTDSGEIIGLYIKEEIAPGQSVEATVRAIRDQGGLVYVPHPYDEKRSSNAIPEEILQQLSPRPDCVECHNGRNIDLRYSVRQEAIADRLGCRKVIGSDAHTFFELGRNVIFIPDDADLSTPEGFLRAIEGARFQKRKCQFLSHRATVVAKLLKRFFRRFSA